ncbi:hypothetical protein SAMN05518672_1143 [Chitinophaga sp. CF118]|uniref:hypothetical protein n=1 Tax=Chitinophaga sp. CF118 TaxID=1884367 RepID=UPI0008E56B17|nr:hypothetical protein [Chitinophaga sp. CF118]SFF00331.1 hypothetical protein SAMN05518672_1143 [Chitinophaga sp. CF118]
MSKQVIYFLLLVVLSGCSSKPHVAQTAVKEKKITKINFFMETSGSMAGYLQGSTDFRNRIPNLLVNIGGKIDSGKVPLYNYYIADSIVKFPGTTQDFINAISIKQPAKEKSSEMHKIFKMIAAKTDSNDISIFVSDCILSYPDDVLRKKGNENLNRDNAEGELKSTMTTAFIDLQHKNNMCASIFGFNSAFTGNYYTYQNNKIKLDGSVSRPYYIWVIGNRDLLIRFNQQLNGLESFQPHTMEMDFGLFGDPIQHGDVLFGYDKEGEWSVDGTSGLKDATANAKKTAAFAMVVDLSSLPEYAKDTNYLRKHLQKNQSNLDFNIEKIELTKNINIVKLKNKEQDKVNKGTHVFVFRLNNIFQSGTAAINLPLEYDTTYKTLSIMDDRNVADIGGKTFALKHLIDGVRAAYQNNNQNFINISIPIKK